VDGLVHSELLIVKLPFVFFNPWIARRTHWADAGDVAPSRELDSMARSVAA
jgi:hypothetical protein